MLKSEFYTPPVIIFLICTFAWNLLSLNAFAESTDKPNIVFVLVDDMGYGDPGCYNPDSKIPTPHIDSLAKTGMKFTDAHAAGPLCHMSRYGLLTGRYPFRTNVNLWPTQPLIKDGEMTIASVLKSNGYHTAMVGKWHLGFHETGYDNPLPGGPVDCGFDTFFGIRASTDIPPYFYIKDRKAISPPSATIEARNTPGWTKIQGEFWRAGGIAPGLELKEVLPRFTEEAEQVIHQHALINAEQPLLLYLAYPAPHTPWLPSQEFVGKSEASLYGDFVVMVDHMIGRVLKKLEESNMTESTLVIFSSDNGPTWYEHDVERFQHDASGGFRGMKADAWEAGHRIPFIARWPGKIKPASTSHQTICFTDMLATFAAIVEQDLPTEAGPDSYNILPVLLGEQPDSNPVRDQLVIKSGSGFQTIRVDGWKLITGLGSGGFSNPNRINPGPGDPPGQLYNLETDPGETNNLYLQHPEIVTMLQQKLEQLEQAGRSRPLNQE